MRKFYEKVKIILTRTKIIRLYQDEVIDIMRNGGTKINAHDKCCVVILAFFL